MVTEDQILKTLEGVNDPELGGNVVELGMITSVDVNAGHVTVGLALTIAECPLRTQIEGDTTRRVAAMPGVDEVTINTTAMSSRQRSELMSVARRKVRETADRETPARAATSFSVTMISSLI